MPATASRVCSSTRIAISLSLPDRAWGGSPSGLDSRALPSRQRDDLLGGFVHRLSGIYIGQFSLLEQLASLNVVRPVQADHERNRRRDLFECGDQTPGDLVAAGDP